MSQTHNTIAGLRVHPAAEVFPLLDGEAFKHLCEDIKETGLREPIWRIWQDSGLGNNTRESYVLDGRNRLRACEVTRVKPQFRDYDGDDPVAFVLSLNLHRQHLDESQRAMVAAKISNLSVGRPKIAAMGTISKGDAADQLNVSPHSVTRARGVLARGTPELVAAVESGDAAVRSAYELSSLPEDEQREIVARGPVAIREAAAEVRRGGPKTPKPDHQPIRLTERQQAIKDMRGAGKLVREIADALGVSTTVISKDMAAAGIGDASPNVKLWTDIEHAMTTLGALSMRLDQLTAGLRDAGDVNASAEQFERCAKEVKSTEKSLRAFRAAVEERSKS